MRNLLRLMTFGVAALALRSASGAEMERRLLPPLSCTEESKAAAVSIKTAEPNVTMDVENGTDRVLQVFQIDANGKRDLTWTLRPQHGARSLSSAGETWVVTDEEGQCVSVFRATSTANLVRLGELPLTVRRGIPPYAMRASLAKGRSLSGDGKGAYVDGVDSVSASICEALNLWLDVVDPVGPWAPCGNPERHNPPGRARTLRFDLSHPVAESGAIDRAVIEDGFGNVHIFWRRDQKLRILDSIQTVPVGRTVESDRVQMAFKIDGDRHALQFGSWVPGEFNPTPGAISGTGTTNATITRISNTLWRVDAPDGSMGRLWSLADPKHPKDLGLYRFSFGLQFELLPGEAK